MKYLSLLLLTALLFACSVKENPKPERKSLKDEFSNEVAAAQKAYADKDMIGYKTHIGNLRKYAHDSPNINYAYAEACALAKDYEEALVYLEKSVKLEGHSPLNFARDTTFKALWKDERFVALAEKIINLKPICNCCEAYSLNEKDLIPEGTAYDPVDGKLYISSIYKRKIVAIDKEGNVSDFIKTGQDGILPVIGMEVDAGRRHLWACSAYDGEGDFLGKNEVTDYSSGLFQYDLATGKLINKFFTGDTLARFFNDLTITKEGDVYATDWFAGDIYYIPKGAKEMQLISHPGEYLYPNGITLSDDEALLFIAHMGGITTIDLKTKEKTDLNHDDSICLSGIDGLAYYNNTLIAHQGWNLGGVYQYSLDEKMKSVVKKTPIEVLNPKFDAPTTGEIAGDEYYFIANAQLSKFHKDGRIFSLDSLKEVSILKLNLTEMK